RNRQVDRTRSGSGDSLGMPDEPDIGGDFSFQVVQRRGQVRAVRTWGIWASVTGRCSAGRRNPVLISALGAEGGVDDPAGTTLLPGLEESGLHPSFGTPQRRARGPGGHGMVNRPARASASTT